MPEKQVVSKSENLSALHEKNVSVINGLGRPRINAGLLFDYLEVHPLLISV